MQKSEKRTQAKDWKVTYCWWQDIVLVQKKTIIVIVILMLTNITINRSYYIGSTSQLRSIKGRIKCIVRFVQSSLGTFFRVNLCTLWCRSRGSISRKSPLPWGILIVEDQTLHSSQSWTMLSVRASRDISFGVCQFVCLKLYVWRLSRSSGNYELVVVKLQTCTYVICQLVSMSLYVLRKNMQSKTYKEVSHKLYVLKQTQ